MNPSIFLFVIAAAAALLGLPRRFAALPILAVACYMTLGQEINFGPISFTALRIVIAVGLLRIMVRREVMVGGVNRLDLLVLVWGGLLVASSLLREDVAATLIFHLGLVYNTLGIYFLFRVFCSSVEDLIWLSKAMAFVLAPVALAMVYEHVEFRNVFSVFGGVSEIPAVREGQIRASGPFLHPILAGTVGGLMMPFMMALWHQGARRSAIVGALSCATMVFASGSSGPLMSMVLAGGAVFAWRLRAHMRTFRWGIGAVLLGLIVTMDRPPYYIIQRFEIFGGSTGWYRARLIESAVEHLEEWWLAGTDYTRHWMPAQNAINDRHTDVTNHYLAQGIQGGLLLLLIHVSILLVAFCYAGNGFANSATVSANHKYWSWILGCVLFGHTFTMISVSYFDQSAMFLYLTLAAVASMHGAQSLGEAPRAALAVARAFAPVRRAANRGIHRKKAFGLAASTRGASPADATKLSGRS
jgi:hypothetical protein